jgi:hypothetical protein
MSERAGRLTGFFFLPCNSKLMRYRKLVNSLIFFMLFLPGSVSVQAQYATLTAQPPSRQLVAQCVDHIYNFEFGPADDSLLQLSRQAPGHPVVSLLRAVNNYWRWFPARTNARLEAAIRQQLVESSKASGAWLKKLKQGDASRPEAMYTYFSSEALLAKMDNLAQAKLASVGHAKNAYPYIRQCADHQAEYPDFKLVAGLYNYYREEYPQIHPFYKTLVWFMRSGNKEEGIRQLKAAARESLFSKAEAGFYLVHLLADYEKRPAEALPTLQSLLKEYPDNLYLRAKMADVLLSAGRPADAKPYIQSLLTTTLPGYRVFGQLHQARYDLLTGQLAPAQAGASALLRTNTKDELLLAYATQVLAQVARQRGQKEAARTYYKKVLDMAEYPLLRDEAEAYLGAN